MTGFETFLSIIITVGGIFFVFGQFRNGSKANANDTINLLEKRANTFEQELKEQKVEARKDHEELIRVQEQLKLKEQRIKDLEAILQGRDPALLDFIKSTNERLEILMQGIKSLLENQKPTQQTIINK